MAHNSNTSATAERIIVVNVLLASAVADAWQEIVVQTIELITYFGFSFSANKPAPKRISLKTLIFNRQSHNFGGCYRNEC